MSRRVRPILLDFEARSRADLRVVGGRNYWAHPSTEVLCCAWYDTRTGERDIWRPGDEWPHVGRVLSAHNANGFDRFGGVREGFCREDEEWIDTAELARQAGLPGALDALGTRWLGIPKDAEGSALVKRLSSVRKPRGFRGDWMALTKTAKRRLGAQTPVTRADLKRVEQYNASDVDIQIHGWPLLAEWLDVDTDVRRVNRVINDRGVAFDSELAAALLRCDELNGYAECRRVGRELGWSAAKVRRVARSPKQFCAATGAPNAQQETVELMDHPLAKARLASASIVAGKLRAGLARVSDDGRLRDSHRYCGAHTWRWSGVGMQLQNMTRPADEFESWSDEDICRLARAVIIGAHVATQPQVDLLLRATLQAEDGKRLVVRDFSGVEARANAWAAGDEEALRVFRNGTIDPYKVMAADIFGVSYDAIEKGERRTTGKMAELGCGYGMGDRKFALTAKKAGVDLGAVGVSAKRVVDAWRKRHAAIVRFWHDCERAFRLAAEGRPTFASCFEFACTAEDVVVYLPSGRPLVYPEVKFRPSRWGGSRPELTYLSTTHGRAHLYGGKIVENVIQAFCRDMLAEALVECERRGLPVVMHVHDEAVCEVRANEAREAERELHEVFTAVPPWAPGFPIRAAGFTGGRYRK